MLSKTLLYTSPNSSARWPIYLSPSSASQRTTVFVSSQNAVDWSQMVTSQSPIRFAEEAPSDTAVFDLLIRRQSIRVSSPRLANPKLAKDFEMEVMMRP